MDYVVLDLETDDPWISSRRGSGWVENKATFLCAATYIQEGLAGHYSIQTHISSLEFILKPGTVIVAHNAQYEAGVLHSYGFDITSFVWVDTRILAILKNNNMRSFSLASLAEHYLGETKNDDLLVPVAHGLGLCRAGTKGSSKLIKQNMSKIYDAAPEVVQEYCKKDVELTHKLLEKLDFAKIPQEVIDFHSDLIKALILSRARGIRIHVPTCQKIKDEFEQLLAPELVLIDQLAPGLNPQSPKQLAEYFEGKGIDLPRTDPTANNPAGQPSTGIEVLSKLSDPLAQSVVKARKLNKLIGTYLDPVLALSEEGNDYVRIYPTINIYGADRTGRCSSSDPNIQNVPTRGELGSKIRSMYRPSSGKFWGSADFASQELRLMCHYAILSGATGAEEIENEFTKDPLFDIHSVGAKIINTERRYAKEITLGIPYGLKPVTMATKLGIEIGTAATYRRKIIERFPFLDQIHHGAYDLLRRQGYVTSIRGRRIRKDNYKDGLNSVVQGSAADQTNTAIVECYRQGIIIIAPIHDSLEFEFEHLDEAKKVVEIMESCIKLKVPVVSELKWGRSWGELSR